MRHVIIGGGIAGTTAAEELRKLDHEAEIVLVSDEPHVVYSRVMLPLFLIGKVPRERVFLKKETWYEQQRIEWLVNTRVEEINVANRFVLLSDGRELEFDTLLIATGGEVRSAPFDRRGVSYFRTLDDADHLDQLLRECAPGDTGGIYGGGFIACEYINLYDHFRMKMRIAFRGPYFWSSMFDEQSGALVYDELTKHGADVRPHTPLEPTVFEDCPILGIGIGVEPDLSMLKQAGIPVGRGVKTNEYLETDLPGIFAAGDIAEYHDVIAGRQIRAGNWLSSMMQGRVAAQNMVGKKTVFKLVPSYAARALGLEIIFVGDTDRSAADEIRVIGSQAAGGVSQAFLRNGIVVGATMVGRNTDRAPLTKAIQEKQGIPAILE